MVFNAIITNLYVSTAFTVVRIFGKCLISDFEAQTGQKVLFSLKSLISWISWENMVNYLKLLNQINYLSI